MPEQASALITMLYTDIEGSTQQWERFPEAMHEALARHDAVLRTIIAERRGKIVVTTGDGVLAVFTSTTDAVHAALAMQRALAAVDWGEVGEIKVRMGLHTGEAVESRGDYHSPALNRGARLMAAGHGGQILLSAAAYELIRDHLPAGATIRDLGEHRLKDLTRPEHIYQIAAEQAPQEFAPLKTLDYRPNNLPLQATPLIGREQETARLVALLRRDDVRLVTLTGMGGVGKTRLSLQAAADLLDDYRDGACFVALAPISDAGLVLPAIAQALGLRESRDHPLQDTVLGFLRDKELLLVLDNFEQVLAAAPLVADLLRGAARLKVLVSSRFVLRLYGEREYPVPPLAVPEQQRTPATLETISQFAAVSLFIARAQLVKPDFMVTNETAPVVADICAKLDGLPLAIELAAARIKLLSPQALRVRLESRLKVLTGGASDMPARQQTLRGAIDWSYNLLNASEKDLFAWLSVFAGGWTVEAAEAVWATGANPSLQVLDGLSSLVDKSLVRQEDHERTGEPRFTMLETLREYATERLEASGARDNVRGAHARYFLELLEEAEPYLIREKQVAWLARLEDEHENLRAMLHWALDSGEIARGLRMAGIMGHFWWLRGYLSEGRGWLDAALAAAGTQAGAETAGARAAVLWQAARLADAQGDTRQAMALAEAGLALRRELGDRRGIADCLNLLGGAARRQGEYGRASELHAESLAICREFADAPGIATSLNNLGIITAEQGNYMQAIRLYEESLALRRKLRDKWGIAAVLNNLGLAAAGQGDHVRATILHEESLALHRELGDKWGIAASLINLGDVATLQHEYPRAAALYQESLALSRELGNKSGIAISLVSLGWLASRQQDYARAAALSREGLALHWELGDKQWIASCFESLAAAAISLAGSEASFQRAAVLFGAAAALRAAIGVPMEPDERAAYEEKVAAVRTAIGEHAFSAAWEEGQAMALDQAVVLALAEPTPA